MEKRVHGGADPEAVPYSNAKKTPLGVFEEKAQYGDRNLIPFPPFMRWRSGTFFGYISISKKNGFLSVHKHQ